MKPRKTILLAILLLFSITNACQDTNSGDDDGNDDNNNDDDTASSGDDTDGLPESCDENTPPEVYSVAILVNGEYREGPIVISGTDHIVFEFEYYDADCNLEGGIMVLVCDEGYYGFEGSQLEKIGCSSEAEGEPYRKEISPELLFALTNIEIGLQDDCIEDSNRIPVDITVHY